MTTISPPAVAVASLNLISDVALSSYDYLLGSSGKNTSQGLSVVSEEMGDFGFLHVSIVHFSFTL